MARAFNPTKEETELISRDPYVIDLVKKVKDFAYRHCYSKNLYAWREFIDDLKTDLEMFIYDYELAYRKGLYGKTGYAAYCNAAKQQALNWAAYYSAQKRRANYESISIEASMEREDRPTIQLEAQNDGIRQTILLTSIGQEFGKRAQELCTQLLAGEVVSRADLKELRNIAGLRDFLIS